MRALGSLVAVIIPALAACDNQPPPPAAPQIALDKGSMGFGQEFGTGTWLGTQTTDTLIVMNEGQQDLVIASASKSGDTTGSFIIDSVWNQPIPYNGQGFIRVIFRARDAGVATATMTITSNAENYPTLDVPLSGRGMDRDAGQ